MKQCILIALAFGMFAALPAVTQADDLARDRAAEAQDVTSALGLESDSYRVVSVEEAEQIRGTGGCLFLPRIRLPRLGLQANVQANVFASVGLLNSVHVSANANVFAGLLLY